MRSDKVMRLGNEIEFGQENKSLGTLGTYASRRSETSDMTYNYFCYDIERDFFYRHIARTHLPENRFSFVAPFAVFALQYFQRPKIESWTDDFN